MLSKNMEKALNEQINAEVFSTYLYLSMAAWFHSQKLAGFGHWMEAQAREEWEHTMKFFHYVDERGGRVLLGKIDAPQAEWESPLEAFKAAYEHEKYITGRIHELVALAREENDYATENFLQWFVTEQVEEESSTGRVVDQIEMVADSRQGLFMLDRELGARGRQG